MAVRLAAISSRRQSCGYLGRRVFVLVLVLVFVFVLVLVVVLLLRVLGELGLAAVVLGACAIEAPDGEVVVT